MSITEMSPKGQNWNLINDADFKNKTVKLGKLRHVNKQISNIHNSRLTERMNQESPVFKISYHSNRYVTFRILSEQKL